MKLRKKRGGKRWKEREKRGERKHKMRLYIHLSLNIGITRMPLFRRLYLGVSIYTKIFGRLPGTRHSLRFQGPSFPPERWKDGQPPTVCGKRRLKATVRNSSPFVEYQASANRCLQLRLAPRFRAIRGYPIFFFTATRSLSLFNGMKSSCNLDSEKRARRTGHVRPISMNSSPPVVGDCDWWENCAVRGWENRILSDVYISTSISEHFSCSENFVPAT